MPPLPNVRQEKFVQGLFEGKSATQAYADAGYRPNQGNSSRMKWYEMVQDRLRELQEAAAKRSEITVASLMAELEDLRVKAVSRDQYAAGVRAVAEKIKLSGLSVQKVEVTQTITDDMSVHEILAEVIRERGMQAAYHLAMAFNLNPADYGITPEIRDAGLTPQILDVTPVDAKRVVSTRPAVVSTRSQYATEQTKPTMRRRPIG